MVKLQYDSNRQYKLTLPKALIEAKGWKKGDIIDIKLNKEGNLVISKRQKEKR